jgi:ethanolamine ammonia-lyase small subunit
VEEAEIAAEAAGAADGVLTDAEMAAVRKQLEVATTNARTELDRLKAARLVTARGGRNRRTKKTNYYRKRRRTTHNRSRRNLN